jgi:hypothetical protein
MSPACFERLEDLLSEYDRGELEDVLVADLAILVYEVSRGLRS